MGELPSMLASRYGDRDALIGPEQTQSFAELEARANSVANVLVECGVAPGDRVGMYVPNTLQFPESYFGIIKAGAIPVPLNLRLDTGTLEYVLNDSEATYLVASDTLGVTGATLTAGELADRAAVGVTLLPGGESDDQLDYDTAVDAASPEFETVDRAYDDVCLQLYTSGTTGKPKGVHSTHQNLLASNESFARSAFPLDPSDSALCVMPLFHIFGIQGIMGAVLYSGGSVVIQREPDADRLLGAIENHELTLMYGVPAIYNMITGHTETSPAPTTFPRSTMRCVRPRRSRPTRVETSSRGGTSGCSRGGE